MWTTITGWFQKPLYQDKFLTNGQMSVNEFTKAGDHLCTVCQGWKWKSSLNSSYIAKYLDKGKQFLMYEAAVCKKRITQIKTGDQQILKDSEGQEIIILHKNELEKQKQIQNQDVRYYNMYIIYDAYYHCPRMSFTAVDFERKPISNESIRQDIQKQYLDKTLTIQKFPFLENVSMATVHPCKHTNVLHSMTNSMRQSGQNVKSHFALIIFLKFIASVIPTVEFDTTGDLPFE